MELLEAADQSITRDGIEFHLLRTISRAKLLGVNLLRVARNWELPKSSFYPETCLIPQAVSCLDPRALKKPQKARMLVAKFGRTATKNILSDSENPHLMRLGVDWTVHWPHEIILGGLASQSGFYPRRFQTNHRILLSNLGMTREVPVSSGLHQYLGDLTAQLYKICPEVSHLRPAEFRLRYDDLSQMVEIRAIGQDEDLEFTGKADQENMPLSVISSMEYLDFDDPDLTVYLQLTKMLRGEEYGLHQNLADLLDTMIQATSIWAHTYTEVSIVREDHDLERLIQPWTKFLSWAKPVHTLFFRPMADRFYLDYLKETSCDESNTQMSSGCECYYQKKGMWRYGLQLFSKILDLGCVLTRVRITRNVSELVLFWKGSTIFTQSETNWSFLTWLAILLHKPPQDTKFFQIMKEVLEPELAAFQVQNDCRIQAALAVIRIGLSKQQLELLFTNIINPLTVIQSRDTNRALVSFAKHELVHTKDLSDKAEAIDHFIKNPAEECPHISRAIRYKRALILFKFVGQIEARNKGLEVTLIDSKGGRITHSFPIDDDIFWVDCADDYAFYTNKVYGEPRRPQLPKWSDGKLVWMVNFGDFEWSNPKILKILDFSECMSNPKQPPINMEMLLSASIPGSGSIKFPTNQDEWTVGFSTVSFLAKTTSTLPHLITSMIHRGGIGSLQYVDWQSHFREVQICKLVDASKKGLEYEQEFNLIAAEDSRTLYILMLGHPVDTQGPPECQDLHNHLWILCFKWYSRDSEFVFTNKKRFNVEKRERYQTTKATHPLVTRIVRACRRDFLLVGVGNPSLEVFGLMGKSLMKIGLNGRASAKHWAMPGQRIYLAGIQSNYYSPFSVVQHRDKQTGKPVLDVYTMRFTF